MATPLRCESGPVFLSNDGRFFCTHGRPFVIKQVPSARKPSARNPLMSHPETPIAKKRTIRRRFGTRTCGCHMAMPNRTSFPELPFAEGCGDASVSS